jgi:hypothetical protein
MAKLSMGTALERSLRGFKNGQDSRLRTTAGNKLGVLTTNFLNPAKVLSIAACLVAISHPQ